MKQFVLQTGALVIIIFIALIVSFQPDVASYFNLGGFSLFGSSSNNDSQQSVKKMQIIDSSKQQKAVLSVETADSKEKRAKGLSDREKLDPESAMLFTFPSADKYKFWMKGMKFDLDFIWIRDNAVVDLLPNVSAPGPGEADSNLKVYAPNTEIDAVLEVNKGYIEAHKISIGDKLEEAPSTTPQ